MNKTRYEPNHWHLAVEELKLYDMAEQKEAEAFLKECLSEIPEHPVHADDDVPVLGNKFVEIDISEKDKKTFNQGLDYLDEILEDLT